MPRPPMRGGLALGLERIGLTAIRAPILVALAAIVLSIAAGLGAWRLKVDDSLSQLFRSDTPEFRQYEQLTERFPSSEFDVLVVVEGKSLLERSSLMQLRTLAMDLQLLDGARGLVSLFSAREPPRRPGMVPPPLFPLDLPKGEVYDNLIKRIRANEIIRGRLLSEDGELALIVLSLEPEVTQSSGLRKVVGEIRETVDGALAGTGLIGQLSGVPVMQLEIRKAVERDRLLYNGIGFLAGCLIAILFFRRFSFMVVAAGPPLIAILWSLGLLGWLDYRLNIFLNVMTPLIMVIGFADSMQLTFAARDRLIAGDSKREAFRYAITVVGPACVLTHATAALSFTALLFSGSDLIRTFGQAGLMATTIALVAVLVLAPLFGMLLVRRESAFAARARTADLGVNALRRFSAWIAARMVRHAGLYAALGLATVFGLALLYLALEPRYRLADQVPDKQQAVEASARLDAKLTGANPINLLVELPPGANLYSPEALAVIEEAHTILETEAGVGGVLSLETLRRWLAGIAEGGATPDIATLQLYVSLLPEHLTRRFIAAEQDAVVITGRVPDVDVSRLLPVVERLDKALEGVRTEHPGYRISVTGLSAIAARNSASMIGRLSQALTIEILFVAAFIGLAFRSLLVMLASILPGVFPIVASGAMLWAMGEGLQFASVVALTVSFGLGLSATIHFLNRLRLEEDPGRSDAVAVERATILVGPALILTSVVLACGLAVTVLSDLPSLRLFGWLSAFAMLSALVADFLILRPTILVLRRFGRRLQGATG